MRKDLVISFIVGSVISFATLALIPVARSVAKCWREASVVEQRIWPELAAPDATHPEPTTEQESAHG